MKKFNEKCYVLNEIRGTKMLYAILNERFEWMKFKWIEKNWKFVQLFESLEQMEKDLNFNLSKI